MKKIILILVIGLGFLACKKERLEISVGKTLELAGENREELQKVLNHYKNQGNEEKLKAAEFLIKHLPLNYSKDTTSINKYRKYHKKYDSITQIKKYIKARNRPKSFWDKVLDSSFVKLQVNNLENFSDTDLITSNYLINNIDIAFNDWIENPYNKDIVSFNDFCEYILPYRILQGKAIEDWRTFFKLKNKKHTKDLYPLKIERVIDTILKEYKNYEFTDNSKFPLLKFKDYMAVKEGSCGEQTWLNAMILRAEGIPVTVDHVPTWANKPHNHLWNSLVYGGKTYPFESFWEKEDRRWIYKKIYDNITIDEKFGAFRLPKVFRHTFSTHIEGPISDKRIDLGDIPNMFKNLKQKDVSNQYFETTDVTIILDSIPDKTYYAYLCVFNKYEEFTPAFWGEIKGNKVTFKNMGRNIAYFPVFYKKGQIQHTGSPFVINEKGEVVSCKPIDKFEEVTIKYRKPYHPKLIKNAENVKGARVLGANKSDFLDKVVLKEIDFIPELRPYEIDLTTDKGYKYYRFESDGNLLLSDLGFFNKKNGKEVKLKRSSTSVSENIKRSTLYTVYDKSITSANKINDDYEKIKGKSWVQVGFKSTTKVDKIKFCLKNYKSTIWKGSEYELLYWNDGEFVSLGKKKASSYSLEFKVPKNALLYIKNKGTIKYNRIFTIKDGLQLMW